jgi:hypothetical protein
MESLPLHAALKKAASFLPTNWFQICLHETTEGTGEHHAKQTNPPPKKTEKHKHKI